MLLVLLALISTVNGGQIKPGNIVRMRHPITQYRNVPKVVMVNSEITYFVNVRKNQTINLKNEEERQHNMQAQEPRDLMRNPIRRRNKKVITDTPRQESLSNFVRGRSKIDADTSREDSLRNPMRSPMITKIMLDISSTKRTRERTSTKRPKKWKTTSTWKARSRGRSRKSSMTSRSTVIRSASGTGKVEYDVWIVFKRREYMVKRDAKSFDDAEASCKKFGAHLVSIHSEEENNFIHKITSTGSKIKSFKEFVYIGLRLNSKNEWEWIDGSGFNYKNWAEHQPDLPDREKCAQFHQAPSNLVYVKEYHWNSIPCDLKMKYYVCKKNRQ
ncbi:unnamed protein product [Cylicocyclus nassatus]|uniref:C-type lectin domain-containing protein n=1 Tax=Cylicocyclus nassatus TaxID=53992 RepID=A0AA36M845_CYLNA|nr:unnamed protein product [Cylicocyclus nassatus]